MKSKTLLVLAIVSLCFVSTGYAGRHGRDVASIEDEDNNFKGGIFFKIDGVDGHSKQPDYENWFEATNLNLDAWRTDVKHSPLRKPSTKPVDPANDKKALEGGLQFSVTRTFNPKSSVALQKLAFSKKMFTMTIRIVKANKKVAMEYTLGNTYLSNYNVSHATPNREGYADYGDSENITVTFSNFQATSQESQDSISEVGEE